MHKIYITLRLVDKLEPRLQATRFSYFGIFSENPDDDNGVLLSDTEVGENVPSSCPPCGCCNTEIISNLALYILFENVPVAGDQLTHQNQVSKVAL